MKKKDQNQIEKKKKQVNTQKEKPEEKPKDKKVPPPLSEKQNFLIKSYNNPKSIKNYNLTEGNSQPLSRKKSEQKNNTNNRFYDEKNIKKDKPRILSHSPDRVPNQNNQKLNSNKSKTLYHKNLTERKFKASIKNENMKYPTNNLKVPKETINKKNSKENAPNKNIKEEMKNEDLKNNIPKKIVKEERKNEEIKNDNKDNKENENNENKPQDKGQLQENYDPNLYGFNLYKHIKENLRNKDKLCKDKLTKESYYCIDCKLSTCKKCPTFNIHKGHTLVPKYLYYNCDENIFNDTFKSLDSLFKKDHEILDNKKLKETLKKNVNDKINNAIKRLNEIKNKKLKELDKLFEDTEGCIETLKEKEDNIKKDIKDYLEKQKDFYFLQIEEEDPNKNTEQNENNDPDYDVLKNLNLGVNERKAGMIESNNDTYNSTFLMSYDLFKNTEFINNEVTNLINDIQTNKDNYLNEYNTNINQLNEDIEKLSQPFYGVFNYRFLTSEFYKMVSDKLKKYNEKIDSIRKYIFDMVNKDGNFDKIDKDNRVSETQIKQRFDNILNYQLSDKDEALSIKSKNANANNIHKLSLYFKTGLAAVKLKNSLNNQITGSNVTNKNDKIGQLEKIYERPEDIKLDKEVLQKFFAYEAYNTVLNNFRYKKPNPNNDVEKIEEEFDEENDIAKPIAGTNEMQLYDRKTTTLIKKVVKFDKNKHKYTYFLNGCRCVLIKDLLYILGGVDKEKKTTKMAYVYYLKTNELKIMPEMLKPHAYHSVEFLDYYKSIIVLGGENSVSCELYDLNTGLWRALPDMNIPRAFCNLYLDKFTHAVYTFFGVIGNITEKHNYTDVIEVLELKRLALGWSKIDYNNKAEMDFKSGYNKILPLSDEMILIYGATNMRDFVKKAAVYIIPKFEIVKIDNRIFKEIKENSKYSKKLSKILSSYI